MNCLFFLKVTEPSPLQDSSSVRQKGGLPGPPPRSTAFRIHRCPGGLLLCTDAGYARACVCVFVCVLVRCLRRCAVCPLSFDAAPMLLPLRRVRCRVVRCCAAALVSHIRGYGSSTGTHQTTMTTWYDLGKSPRRFPFIIMTYYNQHQSP